MRKLIIRPPLKKIGLWSLAAENLMLGTAAQESLLGSYLHQTNGPALGVFQIEPSTHIDLWDNFLVYNQKLAKSVRKLTTSSRLNKPHDEELIFNLYYATVVTRLIYFRASEPLPEVTDIEGLALYWKKHFNTKLGKGRVDEFIKNYKTLIVAAE